MKITKLGHSCLLVEMGDPVNRTALFDPGGWSSVDVKSIQFLDDIIITHSHHDHFDIDLLKKLRVKFPGSHISAPEDVIVTLGAVDTTVYNEPNDGIILFDSPHEQIRPFYDSDPPQEIGVHYLNVLTHPGDSHSFSETKSILALPVQAPWGSPNNAVKLGLDLKPNYIIPIHDWHWSDEAKNINYNQMEQVFKDQGITFIKPVNGQPFVIEI